MFFFSLLLFSIWLSLFQYEYNQNIYSFIYPTYLLWFCFVVDVRWYRYIYLPPWTYPLFGARVDIWYKYHTVPQLNKIRILFNSPSLYTSIYTYTTAYHCIPCIHITVYPLHLLLKPDYHTMHKRAYAPLYTPVPPHKRRSTDASCKEKPRKSADTGRSSTRLIWYKPPPSIAKTTKKIASITVSYD